jgi:general secretion pathway protein N
MRVRLPLGRGLFFLAAFAFSLVALLPLRLALDWFGLAERGLAAREATGSVWNGALLESQLGAFEMGDLGARLRLLPLLVGRARLDVEAVEGDGFKGGLTRAGAGFGLDDVTARLRPGAGGPIPLATLEATDLSVRFSGGRCRSADGRVRAALAGEVAGIAFPPLAGNARCDGDALLLPLAGPSGVQGLELRLWASGRYRADLLARPSEEGARERLGAAGFRPVGDNHVLRVSGEL